VHALPHSRQTEHNLLAHSELDINSAQWCQDADHVPANDFSVVRCALWRPSFDGEKAVRDVGKKLVTCAGWESSRGNRRNS